MALLKTYVALALISLSGLLRPAAAQLHTDCNPVTSSSKCPADPALGTTFAWDFRRGPNSAFTTESWWLPYIRYDKTNGATLKVNSSGIAPTLTSKFYIMFGRLEVVVKTASGTGIVSDVILESDDQDEIDLEWVATQPKTVQSNYYSPKGRAPSYNQMKMLTTSSSMQSSFHTYTVDWNAERLTWAVDGTILRTATSKNNDQYPQSPMKVTIGLWAGGDSKNSAGTIYWAGGRTDYSKGPFEMSVQSIKVVDYSTGSSYAYSDKSGRYGSIKAANGVVRPHASRPAKSVTVSTYSVPASLVRSIKAPTSTSTHKQTTTTKQTAPTKSPLPVSNDGRCGAAYNSSTCAGSGFGNCCSQYGYCGSGSAYCGDGCLEYYGLCGTQTRSATSSKATSAPTNLPVKGVSQGGYCGVSNGSTTCLGSGFGECCSQYGACGNGKDWCGAGCQPSFGNCDGYPRKSALSSLSSTSKGSSSTKLSAIPSSATSNIPSASAYMSSLTSKTLSATSKTFSTLAQSSSATSKTLAAGSTTFFTQVQSQSVTPDAYPTTSKSSAIASVASSATTKDLPASSETSPVASQSSQTPSTGSDSGISPDGRCGRSANNTTCAESNFGQCCSQYSYCGDSAAYCGAGCQSSFGTCIEQGPQQTAPALSSANAPVSSSANGPVSSPANIPASSSAYASASTSKAAQSTAAQASGISTNGYCGPDNGGMTCAGSAFGRCCSQYGACGNSDQYCGHGCQGMFGSCLGDSISSVQPTSSLSSTSASVAPPSISAGSSDAGSPVYTPSSSSSTTSTKIALPSTSSSANPPMYSSTASLSALSSKATSSTLSFITTSSTSPSRGPSTSATPGSSPGDNSGDDDGDDDDGDDDDDDDSATSSSSIPNAAPKTSSIISASVPVSSSITTKSSAVSVPAAVSSSAAASSSSVSSFAAPTSLASSKSLAASSSNLQSPSGNGVTSTSSVPATSSSQPQATTSSSQPPAASPSTFTKLNCPNDNGTSYLSPNSTPNKVYKMYCTSDLPPGTIGWGGGSDIFQCIKFCDAKPNCIAVTYAPWFGSGACYYRSNVTTIISRENATLAILQT